MNKLLKFVIYFYIFLFSLIVTGITGNVIFLLLGVFLIAFISRKLNNSTNSLSATLSKPINLSPNNNIPVDGLTLSCVQCNTKVSFDAKFCPACGCSLANGNVKADLSELEQAPKVYVLPTNFDIMYNLEGDKLLEEFLNRELIKVSVDKNAKLMPQDFLKKKKILNIVFSVLLFVYLSMIFFHYPAITYSIGGIILIIFFIKTRKFNLMKYLIKEVKARPKEKISNIVMSVKQTLTPDNSKNYLFSGFGIAIALTLIIFWNPRILYEKVDGGYAVRFYLFGITNNETATIPATYKGEKVVSLRGNTFSNMPNLREVSLPDTITEIRGQAFKNDCNLITVNIPSKLEYLGGGAFYNCSSITEIELPDTLEYLGGESFYGASSLKQVKLSNKLTEIRGSTFEYCDSLKSITIPDSVTRIGGHAFYGNHSLKEVIFTENSQLNEIGSSAFRQCYALDEIKLASNVTIHPKAFKESPTTIKYFGTETLNKNTITIYKDGPVQTFYSQKYGNISASITNVKMGDYNLELSLHLTGDTNVDINVICDGSTIPVYDDFYIVPSECNYESASATFDFYYE